MTHVHDTFMPLYVTRPPCHSAFETCPSTVQGQLLKIEMRNVDVIYFWKVRNK